MCYTRVMTTREEPTTETDWIDRVQANGWETPLRLALDVMEPLGPFGAQVMWVLQPTLGAFLNREVLRHIALTLEQPDELARVRQRLDEPPSTTR
ncbi:MAG: hypothetical protein AAGK74_14205 [Chloroflexota bacterium]